MTEVSIHGTEFWIGGKPTYAGREFEGHKIQGLLFNVRAVQATTVHVRRAGDVDPAALVVIAQASAALDELDGLAHAIAEEVQLSPADHGRSFDLDLGDPRRVQRKLPLDALALHDPADGEHLPRA